MKKNTSILLTILILLVVVITGCGGGGPAPAAPTTGTVSGTLSFGGDLPASVNIDSYPKTGPFVNNASSEAPERKIIKFKTALSLAEVEQIVRSMGGSVIQKLEGFNNTYAISLGNTTKSLDKLAASNSNIDYVENDQVNYICAAPNDTEYVANNQPNINYLNLPSAWDVVNDASAITVAVIDTGVNYNHNDLKANISATTGKDYVNNDNDPMDDNGHGTHVAGIIGAVGNNSLGITGVCWKVKILPIKVLDSTGRGYSSNIASAIKWAVDTGHVNVINLSIGGRYSSAEALPEYKQAIDYAIAHNVTIVAAAGNENSWVSFPANYQPQVIAVSALNDTCTARASYSNYGPEVTVCAPGGDFSPGILSADYSSNTSYIRKNGTSMACPHITGLVALLQAQIPGISPYSVKERLQVPEYVTDLGAVGRDDLYGVGLPNAQSMLTHTSALTLAEVKVYVVNSSKDIESIGLPIGGNFSISNLQPGTKYICAFLDKNLNNTVDTDDRFAYATVNIQAGQTTSGVSIVVNNTKVIAVNTGLDIAGYLKSAGVLP